MLATLPSSLDAAAEIAAEPVHVTVTWTEDGSRNGLWSIHPKVVTIDSKAGLIIYTFSGESTPGVRFATAPVLWIEPSDPDNFVISAAGQQVLIADANETTGLISQSFSFLLLADYGGITRISPDPTIINKEPSY